MIDEREKLIAEARDWARYDVTGASVIVVALCDALEAATKVDEAKLAEAIDREFDDYVPTFSEEGRCVGSNAARAVVEYLRGER